MGPCRGRELSWNLVRICATGYRGRGAKVRAPAKELCTYGLYRYTDGYDCVLDAGDWRPTRKGHAGGQELAFGQHGADTLDWGGEQRSGRSFWQDWEQGSGWNKYPHGQPGWHGACHVGRPRRRKRDKEASLPYVIRCVIGKAPMPESQRERPTGFYEGMVQQKSQCSASRERVPWRPCEESYARRQITPGWLTA